MVTRPHARWRSTLSTLDRTLGRVRFVSLIVFFCVLVLCLVFSWITRGAMAHLAFLRNAQNPTDSVATNQAGIVDLHPWQIAQALSPLAVSREEVEFAREAERLADHEANQAFAVALRQADFARQAPTGEALALAHKVAQLQQSKKEDETRVRGLTASGAAEEDDQKIAQAQVDLDSDELSDAEHDLARASGDVRSRIQQELAAHQAAMSKRNTEPADDSQIAVLSARRYGTLAGRLGAWISQRSRHALIEQALEQARADAAGLTTQHNALEAQMGTAQTASLAPASARLAALEHRREQRQLLSLYDDRIQAEQQLEGVYGKWASQVVVQHTIVLHMVMRSLATILCLLIGVIVCEAVATQVLERRALEPRRLQTLRTLLRLGIHLSGLVCVLFILFGVPSQISTIVGLATAGLTVALQSFILAFFGWFILMGKNGIRVGDWVEINGVAGEVVEVNLFRTTILESRNWAEKGHLTGRRATFINSFAVSGQFFNFSTAGQWMWDEMSVNLPASADMYEKVARINQAVMETTQQNAEAAEQEWKRVARTNSLCTTSAASSVHMRPAGAGVDVQIRYVTRAAERVILRNRLYDQTLDLLHRPQARITSPQPSSQPSQLTAAVLAAGDPKEPLPEKAKRHSMYT